MDRKDFPVDREARRRENEEVFRTANDRLSDVAEEQLAAADVVPFLCECAEETCMGRVDLTLAEYRELRTHELRLLMLPEHPRIAGEEIVEQRDGYVIAEKDA